MQNQLISIATTTLLATTTLADVPLNDMYMANTDGAIYHINGQTLQATQVSQITIPDRTWAPSHGIQIEYMGNNNIAVALNASIDFINISTHTQHQEVAGIEFAEDAIAASLTGLDLLDDGSLITTGLFAVSHAFAVGASIYNPTTGPTTTILHGPARLRDIYQINGSNMIASIGDDTGRIEYYDYTQNSSDPEIYDVDHQIHSFIENNNQLYTLSDDGQLYTFDLQTREMELYGTITGYEGTAISITIPSPSTLALLTPTLALATRRRR